MKKFKSKIQWTWREL